MPHTSRSAAQDLAEQLVQFEFEYRFTQGRPPSDDEFNRMLLDVLLDCRTGSPTSLMVPEVRAAIVNMRRPVPIALCSTPAAIVPGRAGEYD